MRTHWLVLISLAISVAFMVVGIFVGRSINWPDPHPAPKWTKDFEPQIKQIVEHLTKGKGSGIGYDWLANVTDTFGSRIVGSQALDKAIKSVVAGLLAQGFPTAHTEKVPDLPLWVRGVEVAQLLKPRKHSMAILGVGNTVATPIEGITKEAVVVRSFEELKALGKEKVRDKIVVYNQPWVSYGKSVAYRSGANEAAKLEAVAVLIRSVTSFSVYSPHTGMMSYHKNVSKIPAACITVEDAEMLWRMQERQQTIEIFLNITSNTTGTVTSNNTIFDLRGSEKPEELVLLSGHFDSWDVGQGAMDDGAGCAVMWQAVTALKDLGLIPKRTIRTIFWTGEENGWGGATHYYQQHKAFKNETFVFVSESDEGVFRPRSLNATMLYMGNDTTKQKMEDIAALLQSQDIPISIERTSGLGEVTFWAREGVPGVWYLNKDRTDYYFTFHHSQGDTMSVLSKDDLDYTSALFASFAYIVANIDLA